MVHDILIETVLSNNAIWKGCENCESLLALRMKCNISTISRFYRISFNWQGNDNVDRHRNWCEKWSRYLFFSKL